MPLLLLLKIHIVMSNINSLKHTACLLMGVYFGTLALCISKSMSDFYVTWCKSIRKWLRLPLRTHSKYQPLICDDLPTDVQLFKRLNKFLNKTLCNSNVC